MENNCWIIHSETFLESYLQTFNKSTFESDLQLETNYCLVYFLPNKEVILLTTYPSIEKDRRGILFKNKQCFDEMVEKDIFPLKNTDRTLFDVLMNEINNDLINNIPLFQNLLNESLNLKLKDLNEITLKTYLRLLQKRNKNNKMNDRELFAFATLFSEFFRDKINGKWVLMKKYGSINPYYEPVVINSRNEILDPYYYGFECITNKTIRDIDFFITLLLHKNNSKSKMSLETMDLLNKKYIIPSN